MPSITSNLEQAMALARKGIYVFPLWPETKMPLTENGYLDATTDETTIRRWWNKWPDANIGIACKQSNIVIIDIDQHPGKPDGLANFKNLPGREKLPTTVTVKTGNGKGRQYWFKAPEGAEFKGNLCEEVQIKWKGYGLAPPSIHPNGKPYRWEEGKSPYEIDVAALPKWMYPHAIKSVNPNKFEKDLAGTDSIEHSENSYPPANAEQIVHNCEFLKHCVNDAENLSEPDWYQGLGVLAFAENGADAIHNYSANYPGYSYEETKGKIAHWLTDGKGPATCKTIQSKCGEDYCRQCPFNGRIKSPIVLGYAGKSLDVKKAPVSFPDIFPGVFSDFAIAAAKSIGCPVDYTHCAILGLVSILLGKSTRIQLMPDWYRYGSLWIALVGKPGDKKSPALELCCIKPLKPILNKLKADFSREKFAYDIAQRQYQVELKAWQKEKTGSPPIEPVKPTMGQITTSDTTVEALGELVNNNPLGVGLVCDELTAWVRGMNQYKTRGGNDRSHYLSIRNNAPIIINRKGKDPIYIEVPYVPVVGCIQPDTLAEVRKHEGAVNDGFLERINFCCPARCTDPPKDAVAIPKQIKAAFAVCVQKLFENRNLEENVVDLSKGARKQFLAAQTEWHEVINSPDFNSELEAFYAKMPGQLAEIILILHEMKRAVGLIDSDAVSAKTVISAKQLADYFLAHAQLALGLLGRTGEEVRVEKAVQWIQNKGLSIVSAREIYTNKVAGCKTRTGAVSLLGKVSDFGYGYFDREKSQLIFIQSFVGKSAKGGKV